VEPLNIISLGAGVQSSVMALMAARGEIGPMPDCAIFADTQWEPRNVYAWLDWLETQLPFPVHRVTVGSVRESALTKRNSTGGSFSSVPYFTVGGGMGRRQCTNEYKIQPIRRKIRELLGLAKGQHGPKNVAAFQWIGISTDEIQRLKMSKDRYIENRWPLIEARMSRSDCLEWMERNGYPMPAKSSCIGCPYHSDAQWRDMRDNDPESWADAVEVDRLMRANGQVRDMEQAEYMHRYCVPLSAVDLAAAEEAGQISFLDECDGMCGV
jgi:hypothetical protein